MNTHYWIGRRFLPERHRQPCRLLVAHRGKFLIEFADGWKVATVRGTFRRMLDTKLSEAAEANHKCTSPLRKTTNAEEKERRPPSSLRLYQARAEGNGHANNACTRPAPGDIRE